MANNRFQAKRTNIAGRTPNTTNGANLQYIAAGEFALNMADGILYSSDGSTLITIGANQVNQSITGTLTVKAISANGGVGASGEVLTSNGTSTYWSSVTGSGAKLTVSNTAPSTPANNDLWWDNSLGTLFIYYGDGDSGQWVESHQSGIIQTSSVAPPIYIQNTAPTVATGNKYMWVQTGLGDTGEDFTIWIEDGS